MKPILALPLLFLFSSCDPGTGYTRLLENNTNKEIHIRFYHDSVYNYRNKEVVVKANSTTELFRDGHIGSNPDPIYPMVGVDSVDIWIDNDQLNKDIMDPANWEVRVKNLGARSYQHYYGFVVNKGDISE
ncbi:MAG: hypothetical protein H6550_09460 [Chitinophagales bacterium]|nr:hypothetical protein [Chitinophagales bacterium]